MHVREGGSEWSRGSKHSADNLPFLKGTTDFLSENKCIHTYYLCTLQRRLGLNVHVPLKKGKLSLSVWKKKAPLGNPLPYLITNVSILCMVSIWHLISSVDT